MVADDSCASAAHTEWRQGSAGAQQATKEDTQARSHAAAETHARTHAREEARRHCGNEGAGATAMRASPLGKEGNEEARERAMEGEWVGGSGYGVDEYWH